MNDIYTLFLVRGLPGSGKTTLACRLVTKVTEADQFFLSSDGTYQFDPTRLGAAHASCQARTRLALLEGDVAVANTFSQRWELEVYLRMAREHGARVTVVDLFDGGATDEELAARNVHGVPLSTIQKMRARWEHDWKVGDPRPPWER